MTDSTKTNAKWITILTVIGVVVSAIREIFPVLASVAQWAYINSEIIFLLYPIKHTFYGVTCGALAGASYPWMILVGEASFDRVRSWVRIYKAPRVSNPELTLARSRVVAAGVTVLITMLFEPNRQGFVFGFMSALSGTQIAMFIIRRAVCSPSLPTPSNLEQPVVPPPANSEAIRR